jgi:Retinal pigment epithelial membrane protein
VPAHGLRAAEFRAASATGKASSWRLITGRRGPCDFGGTLPGGFAAHTKLDARTGELHAIAYFWAWDHVQHVVVNAAGQVSRTTDIAVPDGPMMHDFALTEKYVVFFDLPVTFSLDAVSAGRELPYTWNPAHQARVGLLPRDGSAEVRWLAINPCWVFHTLNAYDDGGRVVFCRPLPGSGQRSWAIRPGRRHTRFEPCPAWHMAACGPPHLREATLSGNAVRIGSVVLSKGVGHGSGQEG